MANGHLDNLRGLNLECIGAIGDQGAAFVAPYLPGIYSVYLDGTGLGEATIAPICCQTCGVEPK